MRILVDIDDVLRRTQDSINHMYSVVHKGKWYKLKDKWELDEFYEIGEAINRFAFVEYAKPIFSGAKIYDGAKEFLEELTRLGHTVVLCTVQNEHTLAPTVAWLQRHRLSFNELYVTGLDPKKNGKKMAGDVMIDDGLHNLEKFDGLKICFGQLWNQGFTDGFRTDSFTDILKHIADHQEMLIALPW